MNREPWEPRERNSNALKALWKLAWGCSMARPARTELPQEIVPKEIIPP
jgi:hypothetical protein